MVRGSSARRKEEEKDNMNALIKLLLGLVLIVAGICWYLLPSLVTIAKGSFGAFGAFVGLIVVIVAKEERDLEKEDIKD